MSTVDRLVGGLLRAAALLLPPTRREWVQALWAERVEVPRGRARLSWLFGGLLLVLRHAHLMYRSAYVAVFGAWVGGVLWIRSTDGLQLFSAIALGVIAAMLVGLPWLGRRRGLFGPIIDSPVARLIRIGGYGLLLAFLIAGLADAHYGSALQKNVPPNGNAPIWMVVIVVWTVYAAAILSVTADRSPATPSTLAIGATTGVTAGAVLYALTPFSGRLHVADPWLAAAYTIGLILVVVGAPALAGGAAARPMAEPTPTVDAVMARARQGALAGALCGAAAALVLGTLTLTTLYIAPQRVVVAWANPDRNVPHGTPEEIRMTVGDDVAKHMGLLVLGPAIGVMLGGVGAAIQLRERRKRLDAASPARPVV